LGTCIRTSWSAVVFQRILNTGFWWRGRNFGERIWAWASSLESVKGFKKVKFESDVRACWTIEYGKCGARRRKKKSPGRANVKYKKGRPNLFFTTFSTCIALNYIAS
jgi:hypothetical protein